jgi:hypothetical protein
VVHECSHERCPDTTNGSVVQTELTSSSMAAKNKVLAGVKVMDHHSEIASVHSLSNDDSRCNKEDVEQEHPN